MTDNLKFSKELSQFIESGKDLARKNNDTWVYLEHILLPLIDRYCDINTSLTEVESRDLLMVIGNLNTKLLKQDIEGILERKRKQATWSGLSSTLHFDPIASRILGDIEASEITTLSFIIELLETPTEVSRLLLEKYKIDLRALKESRESSDNFMDGLMNMLKNLTGGSGESGSGEIKIKRLGQDSSDGFRMSFGSEDEEDRETISANDSDVNPEIPFLSKYGHDMVKDAKEGRFDPMIGRVKELDELMEILCCRKKNNALLLGDPGTGKTSIIEGLSQRIASGNVPLGLTGKRIYNLDLNALVAGTKYRGQYEERLQGVIKDVRKSKDIIVYIDEFHNLVGNGSSSGSGDGANILKPYLARGEFQCIGATTSSEYKKIVEKDGALKRRFQNIRVYQTSSDETLDILKNIKEKYETYHGVTYSDEILKECVALSERFVTDRFFPDKAIDILDMSGARAKLDSKSSDPTHLKELENNLEDIKQKKVQAVKVQDFLEAARLREAEKQVISDIETEKNPSNSKEEVTIEVVAKVIEKISGVPATKIGQSDMGRLRDMKKVLETKVIGQAEAVKDTVMALQRNALGLRDPKKPIASLMMIGPTGSGKTHICKTIAKEFFGSDDALIRFDMSEFSEKHEITKLLGSTASYVGYDDEPLFEKVRNRPHCVVLFDEIEKAAPEIYQVFLNILDEGSVTLGNGVKVNFKDSIIIFTGNIGTKELGLQRAGFGGNTQTQEDIEAITKKALKKTFSPEFINRLTKTIVFNRLTADNLMSICGLELEKLRERLQSQGYTLIVTQEVIKKIVDETDKTYGARDLQRGIVKNIEEPVCDALLLDTTGGKVIEVETTGIKIRNDETAE